MSIRAVLRKLERGELSSEDLVRDHLRRAEEISGANAFITLREEQALSEARASDEARSRGRVLGPLHGVPVTAKDIVWSEGDRTTSGSRLRATFVSERDAEALARVRAAGAILLGKTNLHEFAYGVTNVNPHYGPARNPWDRSRISGGSSGGSAVAVAFGVGLASIGSDTGGSVRIPSALCGTVGLKPTYGSIPRDGVTPLSWSLDHLGPMARSVEDAAVLYEVMSETRIELEDEPEVRGLRLGIHESYFFENLAGEVEVCIRRAVDRLVDLGMAPVRVRIPEVELQGACRNTIAFAEASSYHEQDIREKPEEYGEDTRELLRIGLEISAVEYLTALRARRRIVRAFREAFAAIDVFVAPTTPTGAPRIGERMLENGEELRAGLLRLASPFNTTGFPAISLPCGFTADGRPIGLQLAAAPREERLLLSVARAFEASCGNEDWSSRLPAV
ncbi:MAG TPA: amidase [Vicinamibacteria bacterium]|nr:amidase [Vicinamibacteria bacterium]